jgi:hypothetical protein
MNAPQEIQQVLEFLPVGSCGSSANEVYKSGVYFALNAIRSASSPFR